MGDIQFRDKQGMLGWDGTNWIPVSVDNSGNFNISASLSGADGAIQDGVTGTIKATVKDYTNSNPLAVVLVDTSGDAYTATAGGGGGAVTVADGADVTQGVTTDAAVTGDNSGTLSSKLRGLTKIFADVWDSVNHYLKVNIQNTSLAVTGTFWQATQPVSAASLPLPTGAATSAKQPALGTAGTPSADVITVQGVTSMTPLKVDGSGVTQPVSGTVAVSSVSTSVTPGTAAANLGKAEDTAHTTGDTGVMLLGVRETSPTDLSGNTSNGDYEPIQVSRDGAVWVSSASQPQGGWSSASGSIGATKTDIGTANTPGCVGGWFFYNPNASVAYVQFFNAQASAVTLGTTAPIYSLPIPPTSGANVFSEAGIQHSTAICIAVTTTRAGSTGPGSTVDYNVFYKQ